MPALSAVTSTLKTIFHWSGTGVADAAINRIFFGYSGTPPTESDLANFNGLVSNQWAAHNLALYTPDWSLVGIESIDLNSSDGASNFLATSHVGTATGGLLTAGAALVMKEHIARRYRGGHPRVYLPFGSTGGLEDQNTWTQDFIDAVRTAWVAMIGGIGSGSGDLSVQPVNVSYFLGGTNVLYPSGRYHRVPTPREPPITDPILSYSVNPQVGSQRRRNDQGA